MEPFAHVRQERQHMGRLLDQDQEMHSDSPHSDEEMESADQRKVNTSKATVYWSKVMHVTRDQPEQIEQHIVQEEVGRQIDMREQHRRSHLEPWAFVFSPDDFKKKYDCQDISSWELSIK